jgi:arylsulfatase A-like enzyme
MSAEFSLGALVVTSLLLSACGSEEKPVEQSAFPTVGKLDYRPSILLVTVDTLRRDHLGCYGYPRDTTPTLDALAAEGVVFERAVASMASTLPSHLSILTGLYAHQHGRTSNRSGVRMPFVSSEKCASVARTLTAAGYATGGVVSSRVLDERTGVGDGFEYYESPKPIRNPYQADTTTDSALSWLEGLEADKPFFLWVHYWDTHEPNDPPKEYRQMFPAGKDVEDWILAQGIDVEALTAKFGGDKGVKERFLGGFKVGPRRKHAENIGLQQIVNLMNRYDADLRRIDDELGRLFEGLRTMGLWDETVVAFTADHGQSLGEDNLFGHGMITNVNTFVPLILRFPGELVPPLRTDELVSLVDVMPTILGRFDDRALDAYRAQTEGDDLFSGSFQRDHVLTQQSSAFHNADRTGLKCALLTGRWKYVFQEDAANELYDLDGAGEGVDVLAENYEVAIQLEELVQALLRKRLVIQGGEAASDADQQELIDNLRELGYGGED